jgi:hypothetical protein
MDETKLPKWARDKMEALRREASDLRKDRDALLGQGDPSRCRDLWFEGYYGDETAFPAPLYGRRLIFRGSTGKIQITGEHAIRDSGETWLNINGIDGAGLIVRPHASNVVMIRVAGHGEIS